MASLKQILATSAERAAPALLGCLLVRVRRGSVRSGIIVETEAYPHDDPACHAVRGPTRRNATMFGPCGRAYVYRIHRSFCFNIVTGPEGRGEAVLVRAVEPYEGAEIMRRARCRLSVGRHQPTGFALTNGPGKLCQAFDIDQSLDGHDLLAAAGNGLYLVARSGRLRVTLGPRIGISKARQAPLRFSIAGNPWVSG